MRNRMAYLLTLGILIVSCLLACNNSRKDDAQTRKTDAKTLEAQLNQALPESKRKRALVLHSYHPEYVWVQEVNKGIVQGLLEERFEVEKNLKLDYFYMDTKRKTDEKWKLEVAAKAKAHVAATKPDVVIAVDDNAQKYVVKELANGGPPFIFLGVNADPMTYGYLRSLEVPGGQVTGSIERERFEQSIALLQRLVPGVRNLAILCDDGPTGIPIIARIEEKAAAMGLNIVAVKQTGSFSEWQRYVQEIQTQADALLVIVYHTLKDDAGAPVHENTVLNWTITNSNLPDLGFWSWAVEGGLLCSEAISGFQQGHYAATVAAYVLLGQSPGEFPVDKPQRGEMCVNLARAKMLGIEIPYELARTATLYQTVGSGDQ
ncbi:MAG: ABC transporter substrate binding protein [Desulfosarcinaceae bacterium]|nr:ABC transporter substrate binding protein [Desulfosarcinaceae bacterium]